MDDCQIVLCLVLHKDLMLFLHGVGSGILTSVALLDVMA